MLKKVSFVHAALMLLSALSVFAQFPNDPLFINAPDKQWNLFKIGMPNAWNIEKGVPNILIAIMDTGVDGNWNGSAFSFTHPDLGGNSNRFIAGKNFEVDPLDPLFGDITDLGFNGHGSAVAGVVGADTDNNAMIAAVAPFCKMLIYKAINRTPFKDAVIHAIRNHPDTKVINFSSSFKGDGLEFQAAIDTAAAHGVLVVVGGGTATDGGLGWPARLALTRENVIAVNGTDSNDLFYDGHAVGGITVSAPGKDILSTVPFAVNANGYMQQSGASLATPQVSGLAALIFSMDPDLKPAQVRRFIENAAAKVGGYQYFTDATGRLYSNELGYGRIYAYQTLQAVQDAITPPYYDDCGNRAAEPHLTQGYDCTYDTTPSKTVSRHPSEVIYRYFGLTGKDQQGMAVTYRIQVTYYYEEPLDANPIQDLYIDNVLIDNNRIITSLPSTYTFDIPTYTWQTDHRIDVRFVAEGFINAVVSEIWILESPPFLDGAPKVTMPETDQSHPAVGRMRNFPNPFNPSTEIVYTILEKGAVKLKVYNAAGQEVATLVEAAQEKGSHHASFDASHLPSGVYFSRLWLENTLVATQKMVFFK